VRNPGGALWEDEKAGVGATTAVVWTCEFGAIGLPNGELRDDVTGSGLSAFNIAGVDADVPNSEKEEFTFVEPRDAVGSPAPSETPGNEGGALPKAEDGAPNAEEEEPPNAEPGPKFRVPLKTFGVVLRLANADAPPGAVEGAAGASAGTEEPNAEADGVPKLAPDLSSITDGEGRTPKLLVSHSVALGLSGWTWCCGLAGCSSGSSTTGSLSRRKASSSS